MKDHEIREIINELRDIAIEFHAYEQLRERISYVILTPLKRLQELELDAKRYQWLKSKALVASSEGDEFYQFPCLLKEPDSQCVSYKTLDESIDASMEIDASLQHNR